MVSDRIGLDQIATEYAVEDQIYLSKIKVKTITIKNKKEMKKVLMLAD